MSKLPDIDMTRTIDALGSLMASFTLAEWSVLAGIVTALVSCIANVAYMRRKDAREQRQAELAEREALARLRAAEIARNVESQHVG
ncbi:hypothetical protein G4G28_22865 [Massilia sp. Dwa41.01b]|uniref:HP1 family phage holin n=1 Tax=unclassified Massilia TaxID=2609279 RepID=UPI0016022297|nr:MULTISPECIES: HP1 family phage holin [unclassified Massilia]QNA90641.1 hypothetical protein G4G28_22865 [Massilia sp. Dwa41.01b]QNA97871.1 hypothetical protein G4G31_01935 [Massilia sp. Se16.2.3]